MDLPTKHPSERVLGQWLDGEPFADTEAPDHDPSSLQTHLDGCPRCASRAAALRALRDGLRAWAEDSAPTPAADFADALFARLDAESSPAPEVAPASAKEPAPTPAPSTTEREGEAKVVPLRRGAPLLARWGIPLALAAAAALAFGVRQLGRITQPQELPSQAAHSNGAGGASGALDAAAARGPQGSAVVDVAVADPAKEDFKVFEIIEENSPRHAVLSVVWIDDNDEQPDDEEGAGGQADPNERTVQ